MKSGLLTLTLETRGCFPFWCRASHSDRTESTRGSSTGSRSPARWDSRSCGLSWTHPPWPTSSRRPEKSPWRLLFRVHSHVFSQVLHQCSFRLSEARSNKSRSGCILSVWAISSRSLTSCWTGYPGSARAWLRKGSALEGWFSQWSSGSWELKIAPFGCYWVFLSIWLSHWALRPLACLCGIGWCLSYCWSTLRSLRRVSTGTLLCLRCHVCTR